MCLPACRDLQTDERETKSADAGRSSAPNDRNALREVRSIGHHRRMKQINLHPGRFHGERNYRSGLIRHTSRRFDNSIDLRSLHCDIPQMR